LALGSWVLLGVACGPRTPDPAAALIAPVVAHPPALPACSRRGGRPRRRRGCRSWGSGSGGGGVGKSAVSRRPGWSPRRPCCTPRSSRSATRLATWWRSGDAGSAVAHAVGVNRCACASAARRSRRPAGHAGRAPCGGGARPGGVAPGVWPGAARVTRGRAGSGSASTTWSCPIKACAKAAHHAPQPWL
jgi:hypothetical protein